MDEHLGPMRWLCGSFHRRFFHGFREFRRSHKLHMAGNSLKNGRLGLLSTFTFD